MNIKIGMGFDTHQLVEGRELWLGGILIPHNLGALGHSDADVLLHAICDALLGAANMNDIGFHFSNKDEKWRNIDSKILLQKVCEMLRDKGYEIGNIDATLTLEQPKIIPYVTQMKQAIAQTANIDVDNISIKATTNETMGYVGRMEGVNAYAVCLIYRK